MIEIFGQPFEPVQLILEFFGIRSIALRDVGVDNRDAVYRSLYLYAVAVGTPTACPKTRTVTADNVFLGVNSGGASWLDGKIALPRIENRAWSAVERHNHFNEEKIFLLLHLLRSWSG